MAHSSGTVRELIKLGNRLLTRSELNPRYRELAVMRAATLCGSLYEWAQHISIALEAGLSKQQLKQIDQWRESNLFNEKDKVVLSFVEQTFHDHQVDNEIYKKASTFLTSAGLVELTQQDVHVSVVGVRNVCMCINDHSFSPPCSRSLNGRTRLVFPPVRGMRSTNSTFAGVPV